MAVLSQIFGSGGLTHQTDNLVSHSFDKVGVSFSVVVTIGKTGNENGSQPSSDPGLGQYAGDEQAQFISVLRCIYWGNFTCSCAKDSE